MKKLIPQTRVVYSATEYNGNYVYEKVGTE